MEIDELGQIYIAGNTQSPTFPTTEVDSTHNGQSDAFVARLDNLLSTLQYSFFIGSNGPDKGLSLALDSKNNIFMAGYTESSTFPTTPGAYEELYNGGLNDCFVSKFSFAPFKAVIEGDVVTDVSNSWGISSIDFNNDSYPDIFMTNGADNNSLFRNNSGNSLTKILDGPLVNNAGGGIWSSGCSWADYDDDDDPDIFVATFLEGSPPVNRFYTNNGDESFTEINSTPPVDIPSMSLSPSWADYDGDGDLDLYVANHAGENILYRNDNSTFIQVTSGVIVTDNSESNCATWCDFDNDHDADLFVANGWINRQDCLYKNNGDGEFTKIVSDPVVNGSYDSFGGSWGDYDNDGDMDLYVTHVLWGFEESSFNYLYQNNGDGSFTAVTDQDPVNEGAYSYGSSWTDYDNDGDLDLFVANAGKNALYQNDGIGNLTSIETYGPTWESSMSKGVGWADFNMDGALDLYITNDGTNEFYLNNGAGNNWIFVQCFGTVANRSAIGSKVRVLANINGIPVWQTREITTQSGYCSQRSLKAHFGLGDATSIDTIKVEWSSGQITDILTDVNVNQFLTVSETVCGDADANEIVNLLDIVYLIDWKFKESSPPSLLYSANVNGDSAVDLLDIVHLIDWKFKNGPDPDCL
jgi:hypothetical protein